MSESNPSIPDTPGKERDRKSIPITGVWLRRIGDDLEVLVEVAGDWYRAITEFQGGEPNGISHIAETAGITKWPKVTFND